jgi:hypothetical protein
LLSRVRELAASAETPVAWLLSGAEGMVGIDATALEALGTLRRELAQKGTVPAIARGNHPTSMTEQGLSPPQATPLKRQWLGDCGLSPCITVFRLYNKNMAVTP